MHFSIFATVIASILPVAGTQPNRQPALASTSGLTALVFGSGNSIWISTPRTTRNTFQRLMKWLRRLGSLWGGIARATRRNLRSNASCNSHLRSYSGRSFER